MGDGGWGMRDEGYHYPKPITKCALWLHEQLSGRMAVLVELENVTPSRGRADGADAEPFQGSQGGRPAPILVLGALQMVEHGLAVAAPGEAFRVLALLAISQSTALLYFAEYFASWRILPGQPSRSTPLMSKASPANPVTATGCWRRHLLPVRSFVSISTEACRRNWIS